MTKGIPKNRARRVHRTPKSAAIGAANCRSEFHCSASSFFSLQVLAPPAQSSSVFSQSRLPISLEKAVFTNSVYSLLLQISFIAPPAQSSSVFYFFRKAEGRSSSSSVSISPKDLFHSAPGAIFRCLPLVLPTSLCEFPKETKHWSFSDSNSSKKKRPQGPPNAVGNLRRPNGLSQVHSLVRSLLSSVFRSLRHRRNLQVFSLTVLFGFL